MIAAILALGLWAPALQACRCSPLQLTEYFDRADVVMQVRVDSVETLGDDGQARRARFTPLHDYKNAGGVRALLTAVDGARCGLNLQPGARYWIFGALAPGSAEVSTDSCNGSRSVDRAFADTAADAVHTALLEHSRKLDCPAPAPAEIAARLQLDTAPRADRSFAGERSLNGVYAFALENPLQIQRPPHIATLLIDREREHLLRLTMHGVTEAAHAQWINEKLVLVRVRWNRQLRSDVIVDVEAAAILSVDSAQLDAGRVQRWLDTECRQIE